jgi:multidrug efflux system membrane fusion protein
MTRSSRACRGTLLATALVALVSCKGGKGEGGQGGPGGGRRPTAFPVEVEQIQIRDVEYAVRAVGSVDAFEKVQVTARVAGVVEQVRFVEGQDVKKGEPLAEIEPSRYRLAVRAAQAERSKALAAKAEAEAALQRREAVNERNPGLIRGEELETFRTRARSAVAELDSVQVALEQAELNLKDARVPAPIDGTLQTRTVTTGQFVQVGAVLATLVKRDPLLLRFKVPEQEAQALKVGGPARFLLRDGAEPYTARITHVAEAADEQSRMVQITAEVDDPRKARIRPGSFAEVTAPIGTSGGSPAVPETAIRPSDQGFLAFVVEDGVAKQRIVSLGLRTPDGRVEIRSGIRQGESIVVQGAEALRDNAQVKVVPSGAMTPPRGDGRTPDRARDDAGAGGPKSGGSP